MLRTRLANTEEQRSFYALTDIIQRGEIGIRPKVSRLFYSYYIASAAEYLTYQIQSSFLPLCVAIDGDSITLSEIYISTYVRNKTISPALVIYPARFSVIDNDELALQLLSTSYALGFRL